MSGTQPSSHHRGISRLRAEELLLAAGKDGSFLVRDSETIQGAYTLCLLYQGRVHQYRILPDEKDGKIFVQAEKGVQQRKFVDLQQLIHEYINRGDKNGLVCPMLYPVGGSMEDDRGSDEEEDRRDLMRSADHFESSLKESETEPDPGDRPDIEAFITKYFQTRFAQMDMSDQDGEFLAIMSTYVNEGLVRDTASVTSGGESMNHLKNLMAVAAKNLDKQIDLYLAKIDACRHLFGPMTTSPLVKKKLGSEDVKGKRKCPNYNAILEKITQCRTAMQHLEKKAMKKVQDLTSTSEPDLNPAPTNQMSREGSCYAPSVPPRTKQATKLVIPPTVFEAKLIRHGKSGAKINLTVDIQAGKLFAIKPSKEVFDENNVFTHDKIAQLIKNTKNNCRLDVKIDGRKKETYAFADLRERENFCQLVQQLKNMHSIHQEVDHISLFIGTWNMGDECPPWFLGQWFKCQGCGKTREKTLTVIPHDMYVIGTQESTLAEKDWANRLKSSLFGAYNQEYHVVAAASLWSIRIIILVKAEYKNKITHVQQDTVKTGIANALGNKGAVGVSFYFNATSMCFINTHLTSGHERNNRRNQNVRDIIKGMHLGPKNLSVFDTTNQFHHLFFFGDLNYRLVDIDPLTIIKRVTQEKNYSSLLPHDQLLISQSKGEAFFGFAEEEITFPPTYRLEKGTESLNYEWQKFKKTGTRINAPSWCDRVLWRSYPETYIHNTSYGCVDTICVSDHRPVFATFEMGISSQFVAAAGMTAKSGDTKIVFQDLCAEVKTLSKDIFIAEFHSACLDGPVVSQRNIFYNTDRHGYSIPKWSAKDIPEMEPLFDDRDYLEDQHLLIAVKSSDGMESYGECVLALRSMFAITAQTFELPLSHQGEETGVLRGLMHVMCQDGSLSSSRVRRARRSYELVYMDTEFLAQDPEPGTSSDQKGKNSTPSPAAFRVKDPLGAVTESQSLAVSSLDQAAKVRHRSASRSPSPSQGKNKSAVMQESVPELEQHRPVATENQSGIVHRPGDKLTNPSQPGSTQTAGKDTGDIKVPTIPLLRKPRLSQSGPSPSPGMPAERANGVAEPGCSTASANVEESSNADLIPIVNVKRQASLFESDFDSELEERLYDDPYNEEDDPDTDQEPPPPPPRTSSQEGAKDTGYVNLQDQYDHLQKPKSVNQWLLDLGLPQYIQVFFQNGWDNISYMSDLSLEDLKKMKIVQTEHQQRLLKSINDMKF